jgi:hypothetical protein
MKGGSMNPLLLLPAPLLLLDDGGVDVSSEASSEVDPPLSSPGTVASSPVVHEPHPPLLLPVKTEPLLDPLPEPPELPPPWVEPLSAPKPWRASSTPAVQPATLTPNNPTRTRTCFTFAPWPRPPS